MKPAWQRINDLFARHGLNPPPTRLRDELVMHLLAHDREECAARAELSGGHIGSDVPTQNYLRLNTFALSSGARPRALRGIDRAALAVLAFTVLCVVGAIT